MLLSILGALLAHDLPAQAWQETRPAPSAADIVRRFRESEAAVASLKSLHVRFDETWRSHPQGIEAMGKEREANPDPRFGLPQEGVGGGTLEMAFDERRLYKLSISPDQGKYDQRIWDGVTAFNAYGDSPQIINNYVLDGKPQKIVGKLFLADVSLLRAGPHDFWWNAGEPQMTEENLGFPEDFKITGQAKFREHDCWVLETPGGLAPWYVSIADGRLRGFRRDVIRGKHNIFELVKHIAHKRGAMVETMPQWNSWAFSPANLERRAILHEYHEAIAPICAPQVEHYVDDYREIAPGCFFPMSQGYTHFTGDSRETTVPIGSRDLRVTYVQANEPLPDDLFSIEMNEGVEVTDWRYDPPMIYRHRKNFTPEQWQEEVTKWQERSDLLGEMKQAQEAVIGKSAPPFPEGATWLNGEPMTWESLRGKVVVLDFWAIWCAPCRHDLPVMRDMHSKRKQSGILYIGVHTPGSEVEAIREVLVELHLEYPICIDAVAAEKMKGFGQMSAAFGVRGIPHAAVIDRDGNVAASTRLNEAIGIAHKLAGEAP